MEARTETLTYPPVSQMTVSPGNALLRRLRKRTDSMDKPIIATIRLAVPDGE
jgi:hypothetical protein